MKGTSVQFYFLVRYLNFLDRQLFCLFNFEAIELKIIDYFIDFRDGKDLKRVASR